MKHLTQAEYDDLVAARDERDRLKALINTPELVNFRDAVLLEAVHQRERWQGEHDSGKGPADWHWLVAHLAGRALEHAVMLERCKRVPVQGSGVLEMTSLHREKAVHHVITAGAAIANWHAHMLGVTGMRVGRELGAWAERAAA